jgi:hypothetical protein
VTEPIAASGTGRPVAVLQRWRGSPDLLPAVVWFASRISVYVAGWFAMWALAGPPLVLQGPEAQVGPQTSFSDGWSFWDAIHFKSIADDGYGAVNFENSYAFFPGFPFVMRTVSFLGFDTTVAGLAVSFVAGLLAAVALGRLTRDVGGRSELGVLAWVLAPAAVYLAAPYTEALFCAFAFWAWYHARRGRWWWAGLLGMAAATVRVNGLFLAAALGVMFLTSTKRRWSAAPALALPFLGTAIVFTYYFLLTGSWTTWPDMMERGWGRDAGLNPWTQFVRIYEFAFQWDLAAPWVVQYRFDIIATFAIIAIGIVLLLKRWWGEATLMLLTAASLTTTTWGSVPRYTLILFPIWMIVGVWLTRSVAFRVLYVSVCAPLMLVSVALYVNGYWVS